MDVLSDVLQSVRLRAHIYGRMELSAPWGLQVDAAPMAAFYVVSRGHCWLDVDGRAKQTPLSEGDFVLLPKGLRYALRDAPETPVTPSMELQRRFDPRTRTLKLGGGGAEASLVGGVFFFHDWKRNPMVQSLPPLIHIKSESGASVQWLQAALRFVVAEMTSTQPGAEVVADGLAKILFVNAVRHYIAGGEAQHSGWLKALADPQMASALRLIHESPQKPWTVASLADATAMSRSAFAARFRDLAGESPLRYLTTLRMRKASQMLLDDENKILSIARTVGYDTQAAFGKAFKRHAGVSPAQFRRREYEISRCLSESRKRRES